MNARATVTFEADLQIWGYSLWGDSDIAVTVAEWRERYWSREPLWDRRGRVEGLIFRGDEAQSPPLWWSLPWLSEAIIQGAVPA